ncbi:recombinase family protein [Streptomyces vietnamensis]|uniref:recombinase family protein n=1 Tax=Streptomyces vietnamensis TaxID=362257 RepID=UPI003446A16B
MQAPARIARSKTCVGKRSFDDRQGPILRTEGGLGANLVYKRVSTDQQSTARQNLVLSEAGIEGPVVFGEDPGTSSRLHPLQRPKFRELPTYARPGDTVHISEMFRLVRGTGRILDVLDVLHRDRLALRIHDGAFSAMGLTARHPRTGEPLSTVKFMVRTLAAAGELQRDLQRELTYDGLRAAELDEPFGRPACSALHDVRADATKDGPVLVGKGLNCRALAEPSRRDGPSNALTTRPRSSFERMSQQVHNPGGVVLAHRYLSPARSRSGLGASAGASTGWGRRHG